jgi:uncharacterized membrane protein YdfJ with MMPL/SSD domain
MRALFAHVARLPHVAAVTSPYDPRSGAQAISRGGTIAFATVLFDRRANLLPKSAAQRVVTAAAIMICVFLSFMLGEDRVIKEFGLSLASAVFLDAVVVRCLLLPAVLDLLGKRTWEIPAWLDRLLPRLNIEGSAARLTAADEAELARPPAVPSR